MTFSQNLSRDMNVSLIQELHQQILPLESNLYVHLRIRIRVIIL